MIKNWVRTAVAVGTVGAVAALAGCAGSGTAAPSKPSEPQTVTFWGWAPGYDAAVKAFNDSHKDVQVTYEAVDPGSKGGYDKMLNAVKAGNAPCLAQVGYETLPSFLAQGALEDVSKYAKKSKSEFTPATWAAVSIGDKVYGAPVDSGPMAMFYNKEVFDKLGIAVPTTWDEYKAAAQKIHAANPKNYISSSYMDYDYAGFDWQANAPWFAIDGDKWKVSYDSEAGKKVADYWQGMAKDGLISPAPMWDQSWYKGLGDGSIATHVGAVWIAGVLKGSAQAGSGKWAVAPMPQWNAGDNKVGNVGGSATAVLKGCKNPEAAWEFAHWMSTDPDAYSGLVKAAALYPAATKLLSLPALSEGDPYFGGQKIFDVFAAASPNVQTGWTWGPNMPQSTGFLDDGLGKAWANKGTFDEALSGAQQKTVEALKSAGMSVSE